MDSTVILIEYLFLCPYAGQAFHFFFDKKTKQKITHFLLFCEFEFVNLKISRLTII